MMKRVGIIISSYNHQFFINQCLSSCLNQTYPHCEIFIRDDASSDRTASILTAHKSQIKWLETSKKNLGIGASYNYVAKQALKAKCDYLFLIAGDDWLEPDCVEKLVEKLELEKTDLIFPQWNKTDGNLMQVPETVRKVEEEFMLNWFTATPLVTKEFWINMNGFRENIPVPEDWDMWVRMLKAGVYKYSVLNNVHLYNYRVHPNQTSQKQGVRWGEGVEWFKKEYNL